MPGISIVSGLLIFAILFASAWLIDNEENPSNTFQPREYIKVRPKVNSREF